MCVCLCVYVCMFVLVQFAAEMSHLLAVSIAMTHPTIGCACVCACVHVCICMCVFYNVPTLSELLAWPIQIRILGRSCTCLTSDLFWAEAITDYVHTSLTGRQRLWYWVMYFSDQQLVSGLLGSSWTITFCFLTDELLSD